MSYNIHNHLDYYDSFWLEWLDLSLIIEKSFLNITLLLILFNILWLEFIESLYILY